MIDGVTDRHPLAVVERDTEKWIFRLPKPTKNIVAYKK